MTKRVKEINFANVRNFILAYYNKWRTRIFGLNWRERQFEWRKEQVRKKSPGCVLNDACVDCGCETPDKFWEPDPCEKGCYPGWMGKEAWLVYEETIDDHKILMVLTDDQIGRLISVGESYRDNFNFAMFIEDLVIKFELNEHWLHNELQITNGVKTKGYLDFITIVNTILYDNPDQGAA